VAAIGHHYQREKEFIPGDDKLPDSDENDGRLDERKSNMAKQLPGCAPIDESGFEQIAWRVIHKGLDDDDGVGCSERGIR
jgi:hypothetical protein